MSNISAENVTRDDELKLDIESRVDDFNNNLKEQLDNGNFQVNSDVDGKVISFIYLQRYKTIRRTVRISQRTR